MMNNDLKISFIKDFINNFKLYSLEILLAYPLIIYF